MPYRLMQITSDNLSIRFEKDKLKEVFLRSDSDYKLEVIKNGTLGYASSTHFNNQDLLDKAQRSAEYGDRVGYNYPKRGQIPKVKLFSQTVRNLSSKYLIEIGQFLIEALKSENPNILVNCTLSKNDGIGKLVHSNGFDETIIGTILTIYLEGELVSAGDILLIDNYFSFRDLTFKRQEFADTVIKKFRLSKKTTEIASGKYQVLVAPDAVPNFLDLVETATNAQAVYKKVSKWEGQVGAQVTDTSLSIIDDPTIDFAHGSAPFDDEGFAAKPLSIIDRGVLKNFYTDLKNAERLNIAPNGRGFGIPAVPSTTNLIVLPGSKLSSQIIKGTKKGILIDQVIGGGQDNPYSGDFSFNIHLGFLIENGEIVGRVKNSLVTGNIFNLLRDQLREISSDRIWVGGTMLLPYFNFTDVNIVGR